MAPYQLVIPSFVLFYHAIMILMCIVFAISLQGRVTVVIQFPPIPKITGADVKIAHILQNGTLYLCVYNNLSPPVESAIPLDYYVLQVDTAAAAVLPTNLPGRKFTPTAADGKAAAAVVVAVVSVQLLLLQLLLPLVLLPSYQVMT